MRLYTPHGKGEKQKSSRGLSQAKGKEHTGREHEGGHTAWLSDTKQVARGGNFPK